MTYELSLADSPLQSDKRTTINFIDPCHRIIVSLLPFFFIHGLS